MSESRLKLVLLAKPVPVAKGKKLCNIVVTPKSMFW